jgi:hypothetical protein
MADAWSRFESEECTIDKLPLADAEAAFATEYMAKKPLIITGVFGDKLPPALAVFSRDRLLAEHGEREVSVGYSAAIPASAGSGDQAMPLAEFVAQMERSAPPYPAEPPYVFDKGGFPNAAPANGVPALAAAVDAVVPAWLMGGGELAARHYKTRFLTLGGDESGVQFHRHNDGWNLVLAGAKRWFLFPPPRLPIPAFPAEDAPIRDWLDEFHPGLLTLEPAARGFVECVQRRGELLYVPEGFFHGTVNLGDTLAVAGQRGAVGGHQTHIIGEEHRLWDRAKAASDDGGDHARALELWDELSTAVPGHQEAAYAKGIQLFKLGRMAEAVEAMQVRF